MSIILNKRSIDLFFESEDKLKKWFYGLRYFITEKNLQIKIKSNFDFILSKTKLRLINELREFNLNHPRLKDTKEVFILTQMKEYAQQNQFGFETLPFLKVILLYCKVMKLNP